MVKSWVSVDWRIRESMPSGWACSGRSRAVGRSGWTAFAVKWSSPASAVSDGVGYVPADRDRDGLILNLRLDSNVALAALRWISRIGFLASRRPRKISERVIDQLEIRCRGCRDLPRNMSGGNRQKVVLAKWLVNKQRVLILHGPTRGVDVAGRAEIHSVIDELARDGLAIILISDDLKELLAVTDRIILMRRGCISARIDAADTPTERDLIGNMI